jgi:hypothetical protein
MVSHGIISPSIEKKRFQDAYQLLRKVAVPIEQQGLQRNERSRNSRIINLELQSRQSELQDIAKLAENVSLLRTDCHAALLRISGGEIVQFILSD